jgi:hypothetical protein
MNKAHKFLQEKMTLGKILYRWDLYQLGFAECNFFEMGQPQPLHRRDAYSLLLFHLFNKDRRKALEQSYKLKHHQTHVSKHHQTSALQEE